MDNFSLSFAGFETAWNDLPDNSKKALAVLGFSTKIKNAIAGVKAGVLGTAKDPWSDEEIAEAAESAGLTKWGRDEETADAICKALQGDMFNAILSGVEPASRRGGPRLSDDDKLRRAIAVELLESLAKKQGHVLPKRSKKEEKEAFENYLTKALGNEKFAAAVAKEFTERKKKAEKVSLDIDLFA